MIDQYNCYKASILGVQTVNENEVSRHGIVDGDEIQLTDAIAALNRHEAVYAYDFIGKRYDVGEKIGLIQTTPEFALEREDLKDKLLNYPSSVVEKELIK